MSTNVKSWREPKDVEVWGHRGASAHLPENTCVPVLPSQLSNLIADIDSLASFRAAIKEGCDAIESGMAISPPLALHRSGRSTRADEVDVHATSDGVILMFHDPTLDRTTTGTGLIRKQPWTGVIEYVHPAKVLLIEADIADMYERNKSRYSRFPYSRSLWTC